MTLEVTFQTVKFIIQKLVSNLKIQFLYIMSVCSKILFVCTVSNIWQQTMEKKELAAWLVIFKEIQCWWRGELRLCYIGTLKNRSTVSWFICLFVCTVSNTMYFYTQKINRVEITLGSQAVCIVYNSNNQTWTLGHKTYK
jgi:hypothetical protein